MSVSHFRRAALALPGALEGAHQRTADFRVGKRIFATLGYSDDAWGMVKLAASIGSASHLASGERACDGVEERRAEIASAGARPAQRKRTKEALISHRVKFAPPTSLII